MFHLIQAWKSAQRSAKHVKGVVGLIFLIGWSLVGGLRLYLNYIYLCFAFFLFIVMLIEVFLMDKNDSEFQKYYLVPSCNQSLEFKSAPH